MKSLSSTSDCSSIPLYVPTGSMPVSHHQQHSPCSPSYYHRPRLENRSLSIGLPSQYPGHDRRGSLESYVLEELLDFDESFGPSFSSESLNTDEECLLSGTSLTEDDGDSSMTWASSSQSPKDLLRDSSSSFRISPPRRNQVVVELSSSRKCISSLPMIDGPPRRSNHHRRSRGMGSKEFHNVVLKDLNMDMDV
ncbi:hypothetical protein FRACYDRAFT_250084 [Fragilariopsis cylindrus CCMP1102]|uniref:Uncharacterized protein n=1 Tax=Fragilariopsis cylindrus CCMP1102 TaxID=635003 RepID=A0A1E7EQW9_9STRA|nr:hypothetical protein FRACYDRAFT_250084 [Fragilariopsis cylindrus CCMP1102]|eukprot:OEU08295.1 hypothetical protein FRACYDRAFT_250084 [Fragilariopsis cylindrus CCMP1102]